MLAVQHKTRWYDSHPHLSDALRVLKTSNEESLSIKIDGIRERLLKFDPNIIDRFCEKFSLNRNKKRWYDVDPYMWLTINSLRYAEEDNIQEIVHFILDEE